MFSDKELKGIVDFSNRKMDDVLNSEKGSDTDYIHDLQTLVKLKDAANQKIQQYSKRETVLY